MARVYVFADEAGNFDFSRHGGASKYFILGTMTLGDPAVGVRLLDLRRDLAWRGHGLEGSFHAAKDRYEVKDAVFGLLEETAFRFDVVALEKSTAHPQLRSDWESFYTAAWSLHFRSVAPHILGPGDDLMVTAASIGTRRRRSVLRRAIDEVVRQATWGEGVKHQVAFWPADSDPCLQAVDYVTWAVQRKWELGDTRWYDRVSPKIQIELAPQDPGASPATERDNPQTG